MAFALASWFSDCLPVAPLLYLLGAEYEAAYILRLLKVFCRRPVLLADLDSAALRSLPGGLNATLLLKQRELSRGVKRFLLASADPHFLVACGNTQPNAWGARALSASGESVNGFGVRLSFSPQVQPVPLLSDARLSEFSNDFQSKLLRYREVNWQHVCGAPPEAVNLPFAMRDELRTWIAPLLDSVNLRRSVLEAFLHRSQEVEADRLTDDRCLAAEAALFFCHSAESRGFFVGELAQKVNDLLLGRHEERGLTSKRAGCLLRELGIEPKRCVKGYRVSLTDAIRTKIHDQARAYGAMPTGDKQVSCSFCTENKQRPN